MFFRKNVSFIFPESILINNKEYAIEVSFSNKKSSSVNVKDGVLVFKLSSKLSEKNKRDHFESLLERIKKKVSNIAPNNSVSFREIFEKKKFEFSGIIFNIILHEKRITKLKDTTFYVDSNLSLEIIEKKLEKLLLKHFSKNLIDYVYYINSQTYNFPIKNVMIKNVSSKWGHCTHDNTILINLKLLNASKEVLEYVIYHELSHVIHKNHSYVFWNEVSKFCPNYKELRNLLKKNPPSLFTLIQE